MDAPMEINFSPCRKDKFAHSLTGIIQRYMNPPRTSEKIEVRASSKGKWSSRACLVIHWMIIIVLLGMLLVEGGAKAGLSKNVKLALEF
ncbi:unnamed protein product [Prunus armeniaca]|uniref:Uncharacterized protein n=1 Tax=Prunus armeniaca TaxID=36596 RepID=A0A6J5WPR6_PRUAR|nr:unnamed protein product [Prunus armeniaca]CAB4303726.1 unnamed protein product [Prunus armeniaca]